jgi:hypothetical protein
MIHIYRKVTRKWLGELSQINIHAFFFKNREQESKIGPVQGLVSVCALGRTLEKGEGD